MSMSRAPATTSSEVGERGSAAHRGARAALAAAARHRRLSLARAARRGDALSGSELVTVALRRVQAGGPSGLLEVLDSAGRPGAPEHRRLPHGARRRTHGASLPARRSGPIWIKLEVIGDEDTCCRTRPSSCAPQSSSSARASWCSPTRPTTPCSRGGWPISAAPRVMPLGSPIGSGMGIRNPYNISLDPRGGRRAGCSTRDRHPPPTRASRWSSAATRWMAASSIARAQDTAAMALAMRRAVEGRQAGPGRRADPRAATRERVDQRRGPGRVHLRRPICPFAVGIRRTISHSGQPLRRARLAAPMSTRHFLTGASSHPTSCSRSFARSQQLADQPDASNALSGRKRRPDLPEAVDGAPACPSRSACTSSAANPVVLRADEFAALARRGRYGTRRSSSPGTSAAVGIRTGPDETLEELAHYSSVDHQHAHTRAHHPCQALADC